MCSCVLSVCVSVFVFESKFDCMRVFVFLNPIVPLFLFLFHKVHAYIKILLRSICLVFFVVLFFRFIVLFVCPPLFISRLSVCVFNFCVFLYYRFFNTHYGVKKEK